MNQTRSFLLIAWLVVATLLWMEWSKGQLAPAPATDTTTAPAASLPATPSTAAGSNANAPLPGAPGPLPGAPAGSAVATPVGQPITLSNDTLRLTIDLHGGRVTDSHLLKYTVKKEPGSPTVSLLNSTPSLFHVADAGFITVDAKGAQVELQPQFRTESGHGAFSLAPGASEVVVPLVWTDPATGLTLRRTLTLKRGSYVLEMKDQVVNNGPAALNLYPFAGLSRVAPPPPPKHSFMTSPETFSFIGAAWHTPDDNYGKAALSDFDEETPPAVESADVWIGFLQHHFATAWVPPATQKQLLRKSVGSLNGVPLYSLRSVATPLIVAPGASAEASNRLWVGPKLQKPMAALAPTLPLTVDYGVLAFIGKPLFWLLSWLHALFGNWGWAIIAIVVLLKAALYPLSAKQYQSMAKMRAVQPRIEALKERYGDDKQQFQIAMMDLYKKEKINPIGGCLPMLIPIPIFLGLYWVLLETVELRHAEWIGWIQNLTAADPYFILPALNLIVMYLTQKLTPMPGMDPMQKKMMQFMPLVFGVMMAFFPSGLVLYWVTNGLLGLLQQWWMTKQHGPKTAVVAR